MTLRKSLFLACAMPLLLSPGMAEGQTPIPADIFQQMVKGKGLSLVWVAPDFDRTKGLRVGPAVDDTEDGNGGPVLEYVSIAMQRLIRADSPYLLKLAVVGLQTRESTSGQAYARLQVEGQLVDPAGKVKAAFTGSASDSSTGNAKDNARLALRAISYGMSKDIFSTEMMKSDKHAAVIVAAPAPGTPAPKDAGILVPGKPVAALPAATPAPAPAAPPAAAPAPAAPPAAAPAPAAQAPSPGPVPAPMPPPVASPQPKPVPAVPAPKPAVAAPKVLPPLYGAETVASMKRGKGLGKVWLSPAYDRAGGFAIGEVRYETDARNDGIDQYLPEALAEIARVDAPCTLQLRITDLSIRRSATSGASFASLSVNGSITAADGSLLAAFSTRESASGLGDSVADCRTAARQVVLAIVRDLK